MRVALSVACFDDALFPDTGRAVAILLERLGHQVVFPPGQTCCGQIHWTAGYHREAAGLARAYARAFEGGDVVVAPSASCAAAVRDAYPKMARAVRDPGLARAAEGLAVYELTEFLVDVLAQSFARATGDLRAGAKLADQVIQIKCGRRHQGPGAVGPALWALHTNHHRTGPAAADRIRDLRPSPGELPG